MCIHPLQDWFERRVARGMTDNKEPEEAVVTVQGAPHLSPTLVENLRDIGPGKYQTAMLPNREALFGQ
jgi:hypothetical protein